MDTGGPGSADGIEDGPSVTLVADANLPTRFGTFRIYGFRDESNRKEHTAVVQGTVSGKDDCPVRIHSECHTGDVFFSLKCDCRQQLDESLRYLSAQSYGALVYLRQEGRGIGLINKIRAYSLQDRGLDTVEANERLGFPSDMRDYSVAAQIIKLLEIRSVVLLTNNPDKINGIEKAGVIVKKRIPVVVDPNHYNEKYLKTKKKKLGHLY